MKDSKPALCLILLTVIFLLGCALLPIPDSSVESPPTFVMPTFTMPTFSASPSIPTQPNSVTGLENENLLVEVPSGFKIDYEAKQDNMIINEMVPESESVNDWTTLVTVQIFLGLNSTPEQYQETLTQSWFSACADSASFPIANGDENGYPFVVWQLYCPLNPSTQQVEETYFKAIQGNDSFYLVQVAFRHEPSEEEITQWVLYLKDVQVCDSRIPERACP